MYVGDLVTYIASEHSLDPERHLGTILQVNRDDIWGQQYYIVWHTVDNRGWWGGDNLELANENR